MQHRYRTIIEDGIIYVEADVGRIEIGPLDDLINKMGVTYEVSYWEEAKERYDVSFADEGLEIDVAETVGAMTHTQSNIESLKQQPLDDDSSDGFSSRRMALFSGYVGYALDHGPA
jgi:hypothetical protein